MSGELGGSLKRHRLAARITQEELAERAGISARTISDVERGLRVGVHPDTARRLAAALSLGELERRDFELSARGGPAPTTPPIPDSRFPVPPTPLLGREGEVAAIETLLGRQEVRLLTLTGAGGIGKTRLALEVSRQVVSTFPGGLYFVSLGEVQEASLVAAELAKSLGVAEKGADLEELIAKRLGETRTLVVLDTFEHLSAAAPIVYSLLLRCPAATFLVTSRSALRLRGEHEFGVPPLELPASPAPDPDDIARWPATALFWNRARAVNRKLELDRETAVLVLDICRKLDGLPLAIELAAARVRHLPLTAIHEQLDHRLQFLVGGQIDLPIRQRTIADTVGWSHDLLGNREQVLLRRLAVFSGGWRLDAATAVCGENQGSDNALSEISTLVDQSLVMLVDHQPDARYDMLDIVREFAADRLRDAGEVDEIAERHALHYLLLAEEAAPYLTREGQAIWFRRLDLERGNLRRGMAWTLDRKDASAALRYTVALWRYWRQLGHFGEGRRLSDAALAIPGEVPASLRAKALWASSALAFRQNDHGRMAQLAGEALALARTSEDPMDLRNALTIHGMVAMCQGRYEEALPPYRQGLRICQRLGATWELGTSHLNLGTALLFSGRIKDAVATLEEGLRVYRDLGDDIFAARIIRTLALAALAQGDLEDADQLARQALIAFWEKGEREGTADGLKTLAATAAVAADLDRAAILAGAASAIGDTIAYQPAEFESMITAPFLDQARTAAGLSSWDLNWRAGRALGIAEAVAYALDLALPLSQGAGRGG